MWCLFTIFLLQRNKEPIDFEQPTKVVFGQKNVFVLVNKVGGEILALIRFVKSSGQSVVNVIKRFWRKSRLAKNLSNPIKSLFWCPNLQWQNNDVIFKKNVLLYCYLLRKMVYFVVLYFIGFIPKKFYNINPLKLKVKTDLSF